MRSRGAYWFLLGLLCAVGGALLFGWASLEVGASLAQRAFFSRRIFTVFTAAEFVALSLIAPLMAAQVVAGERENRTLDLLLSAGVSRFDVLRAKWLATLFYQGILAICLAPILSLTLQLGGVGGDEFLAAGFMIGQGALVYGMIGLAFSCNMRKSASAMMAALFSVLAIVVLVPAVTLGLGEVLGLRATLGTPDRPAGALGALVFAVSPVTVAIGAMEGAMRGGAGASILAALDQDVTRLHLLLQFGLFVLSARLAWRGLARGESLRPAVAVKLIDDERVLAERRNNWPFYLIDPMRRAQQIRDDQNPVFVKESRVGAMSRPETLIRLCYVGMAASVFLSFVGITTAAPEAMARIAQVALTFMLLFAPIQSAAAVSREREEGTLDLLLASPLAARTVVMAKFWVCMRFLCWLGASVLAIPVLLHMMIGGAWGGGSAGDSFAAALGILPTVAAFAALFSAVGILCSCFIRRGATSIMVCYSILAIMTLGPLVLWFAQEGSVGGALYAIEVLNFFVGPILSPFFYYGAMERAERFLSGPHVFAAADGWAPSLAHALCVVGVAYLLLKIASARLSKGYER